MDHLFSKRHFDVCLFLSLSCIWIFQHILIFRKDNVTSNVMSDYKDVFVKGTFKG